MNSNIWCARPPSICLTFSVEELLLWNATRLRKCLIATQQLADAMSITRAVCAPESWERRCRTAASGPPEIGAPRVRSLAESCEAWKPSKRRPLLEAVAGLKDVKSVPADLT
eukprot:CAMPEP_0172668366 /NCGR_PEP_ID=MMETSP1074-20121228/9014_1 /TAXON_ID=2916 /ORGANISM="Ceratium fusus, Strain PA161109" /LENGTH=111 /DNA_ID=CAMNT_0013485007 /DNA_START=376 /DNA_END=712 /DNA_ORIENTATION=-